MIKINIANDYTDTPGGRFVKDGPFSGEDFRQKILIPKYREAVNNGSILEIDFDGCYGYPSSFLDEAFGGLAKSEKNHDVLKNIKIISHDQPSLFEDIKKSVEEDF